METPDKIKHFHLKDISLDEDNPLRFTTRLYANVEDMTNNTIVDACVKEARKAGINDVYLLDRKFVLDALREKIQGTQREKLLLDKIKQLETERDAAVQDIELCDACETCKHFEADGEDVPCRHCFHINKGRNSYFEWRGVQKEE